MRLRELLARVRITDIADALGIPRRNMRVKAVWRNGDDWTVDLNDAKGTWFDFKTNEGGGILDFIQIVLGCSRRDAVSWLCEYMGVPEPSRPFTPQEKAEYARKKRIAGAFVDEGEMWLRGYELQLEDQKQQAVDRCDDQELERTSNELFVVQTYPEEQLMKKFLIQRFLYPELTRERIELGREDAAHVEACGTAVMEILRLRAERDE